MRDGRAAVPAMIVATLLWGATFVVVRDSLVSIAPGALVAARFGLATVLWAVVLLVRRLGGHPAPSREAVRAAIVGGLVSAPPTAGGYLFQAIGLTDTSAGSSAFLTCTGILFAGVLGWPLLGIRPSGALIAGTALALAGAALLGVRGDLRIGAGEAWTLLGAIVYALQIVAVARWVPRADLATLAAVQTSGTALVLAPCAGGLPSLLRGLDAPVVWRLGYLVLAGSFLAPLLQIVAQRRLTPGRIGLLFALEPVFGLAFALGLGGERFVPRWWFGAALILAAVLLVESRAARPTSRPATA